MIKKIFIRTFAVMMLAVVMMSCTFAVSAVPEESGSSQNSTVQNSEKKSDKNPVKIILISLGVALIVSGVSVFLVAHGYKNNGKTEPYPYNKKAPLDLRVRNDIHVDTKIEKRKIEKKNNS